MELKKDEIWDKNTILQPIEKSLNDFSGKNWVYKSKNLFNTLIKGLK